MTTDHNEAMRLAEWLRQNSSGAYRPAAEAADLLTRQAERIAEIEADYQRLMDKHNALHVNALKDRAERDTLRAEVERLRVEVSANRERDALKIAGLHIHAKLRSIVNAGGSDEVIGREFRKRVLPNIEDEVVKLRDEVKRLREADGWRGRDDVKHSQIGLADALADWGFSVHDDDEGRTWLTIRNPDDDIARVSVATVWPLNGNQTIGAVVLHQLDSALAKARSQRSQA